MELQKAVVHCDSCNQDQECFIIPDGRVICPACSPAAVYERWAREWAEIERAREKEAKRIRQEQDRQAAASAKAEQRAREQEREQKRAAYEARERIEARERRTDARENREHRFRSMPLHKRVRSIETKWIGFAETYSRIGAYLAGISGAICCGMMLIGAFALDETGERMAVFAMTLLYGLVFLLAVLFNLGLYQTCKAVRRLVNILSVPVDESE